MRCGRLSIFLDLITLISALSIEYIAVGFLLVLDVASLVLIPRMVWVGMLSRFFIHGIVVRHASFQPLIVVAIPLPFLVFECASFGVHFQFILKIINYNSTSIQIII